MEKIPSAEVRRGVLSVKTVSDAALDLLDGSFELLKLVGGKRAARLDYARSALDLLAVDAFILLVFLRRSNRYFAARS